MKEQKHINQPEELKKLYSDYKEKLRKDPLAYSSFGEFLESEGIIEELEIADGANI